nr:MAG TPA: hypothetical protein [Caudoviricetes sp.]
MLTSHLRAQCVNYCTLESLRLKGFNAHTDKYDPKTGHAVGVYRIIATHFWVA